jgi:NodT family efflux transporter outer membrane factor (OMF) lipoprotein
VGGLPRRATLAGRQRHARLVRRITSREQVELAASTLRSYEDGARLIRSRYETGTSSALDLRLTLANVASAAAVLQQRSEQFAGALRALEVLAGTYPAGTLPLDADLPSLSAPIPSGLPSELLARRPDLVAAERRLAAAQQRSLRARKDMLPAIRLSSGIGTTSEELENIFDGDALWNLAAGLTQPLFQGGQLRARAGQAAVAADAAALDYARTALAAFRDVEQALAAEDFLRAREAFLLEAVEQSAAAEELSWNEYTAGLGDIVSVLEAQRRAIAARTEYLDVRNARLQNRVNLHVALGGDFRDDDLPDPETPPPVRFIEHMGP